MKKKRNIRGFGRKALLVAAVSVLASTAAGTAVGMASAEEDPSVDDYRLSVLQSGPETSVPDQVFGPDSSLQGDTIRALGDHDGTHYWAGLDTHNNVCLIALFGTDEWVSGSSCLGPEEFNKHGAGLRLYGPEGLIEAYLVPDNAAVDGNASRIENNLYIFDPYAPTSEREAQNQGAKSGDQFSLLLFDAPFTLEDPK